MDAQSSIDKTNINIKKKTSQCGQIQNHMYTLLRLRDWLVSDTS